MAECDEREAALKASRRKILPALLVPPEATMSALMLLQEKQRKLEGIVGDMEVLLHHNDKKWAQANKTHQELAVQVQQKDKVRAMGILSSLAAFLRDLSIRFCRTSSTCGRCSSSFGCARSTHKCDWPRTTSSRYS